MRLKSFIDGCNNGELGDGEKKRCNSWIFSTRYEGKVELRAVCLNSSRVMHYETVKSTTRVKEEDEA